MPVLSKLSRSSQTGVRLSVLQGFSTKGPWQPEGCKGATRLGVVVITRDRIHTYRYLYLYIYTLCICVKQCAWVIRSYGRLVVNYSSYCRTLYLGVPKRDPSFGNCPHLARKGASDSEDGCNRGKYSGLLFRNSD